MTRVALRGLLGRKLRASLTAFAIVLGVAMVSGTFVLTDTIKSAFTTVFTTVYQNTDAVITGKSAISTNNNGNGAAMPSLPASLLPRVRALPQVGAASGSISDTAQLVGRNGKVISGAGAPGLAFSYSPAAAHFNPLTLKSGNWPSGPQEIDIDTSTASKKDYKVGDEIGVIARGPGREVPGRRNGPDRRRLVPWRRDNGDLHAAQGSAALQQGREVRHDQRRRQARLLTQQVVNAIKPLLGPSAQVKTGQGQAQQATKDTSGFLNIFQDFLLAFGGIALFVGSFVIANTLSITIAQRTRELATLRTLGATRRQVLRSVLVEAFVIGTLASIVGLFLGLLLAKALNSLLVSFGINLPQAATVFKTRTIVVSLLVGIVITLIAALRPALRATRVPPIAAVREGALLPPSRWAKYGPHAAGGTVLGAIVLMLIGLFVSGLSTGLRLLAVGIGAVALFIGISMLAPISCRRSSGFSAGLPPGSVARRGSSPRATPRATRHVPRRPHLR